MNNNIKEMNENDLIVKQINKRFLLLMTKSVTNSQLDKYVWYNKK